MALLIWLMTAVMLTATGWHAIAAGQLFDADDQLRLVQVRDLIAGQAWWDMVQHRINPAGGGVSMHWSRIIDAPMAAMLMVLKPLIGMAAAESVMLVAWPLVTLGALFAVASRSYARLGRNEIAIYAIILLATDHVILFQLSPMRIDHHGWQIVCALALMANALATPSARSGAVGGTIAAVLLAISLEGLPVVALFALLAAIEWAWTGAEPLRRRLTAFLAVLAAAAILLQLATRGPEGLLTPWCDSLSPPYLAAMATAALVFAIFSRNGALAGSRSGRLVSLGAVGGVAGAALLLVAPQCAAGPFAALDPLVVRYWYSLVVEGQPVWRASADVAAYTLVPALIGVAGCWIGWRQAETGEVRRHWLVCGAAGAALTILSILVTRTGSTAHAIVMPGCAMAGVALWRAGQRQRNAVLRFSAALCMLVAIPAVAGGAAGWLAMQLASTLHPQQDGAGAPTVADAGLDCVTPVDGAWMNRMPASTILAPLDLGPLLLRQTHHSVVATGHHRANHAMAATIRTFLSPAGEARVRMDALGASMLALCPAANDIRDYAAAPGPSLADSLIANRPPAGLEPVAMPDGSRLRVWRLTPDGG